MLLPTPRGPLGELVFATLHGSPDADGPLAAPEEPSTADGALVLWALHELHYRGFDDVDEQWEWATRLMPVRRDLERALESRLRARFAAANPPRPVGGADVTDPVDRLRTLIDAHDAPSLARHVQRRASREQVLELMRQRSVYHLKEADPTSFVVPRLSARPKAALMEIQFDEYGHGRADRLHHHLFAAGLAASGLCADYGRYIDEATPEVLEQNNALSLFGLHRRLRGAALGHFAAFEATSSLPSRRLVEGLTRLGLPDELVAYYDEHVEADAVHEQVALRDVCGALVREEPALEGDVLLGAWTCLDLEGRTASALLTSWEAG